MRSRKVNLRDCALASDLVRLRAGKAADDVRNLDDLRMHGIDGRCASRISSKFSPAPENA